MTPGEVEQLRRLALDVLDPRGSHLQLRCRRCGATWRPRRRRDGGVDPASWRCWRGCNEPELGGG
jgi:hypothetical protein